MWINLEAADPVAALLRRCLADINGFKHVFINNLHNGPQGRDARLLCWLVSRPRDHGPIFFLSVDDSTGTIQVVAEKSKISSWDELKKLKSESSIIVLGVLALNRENLEIIAQEVTIVSKSTRLLNPEI